MLNLIAIYNPTAGGAEWSAKQVERLLRDAGHTVEVQSVKKKWRHVLDDEPDAYVAVGGDGTVHKVLRAVEGREIPVAILPTGTANNVALALGYKVGDDFAARVARWEENEQRLYLGQVEKRGKRRSFVEAVGIGAFAEMVGRAESGQERSPPVEALEAIRCYLAKQLLKARPVRVSASIDNTEFEGEYVLLECLNLPHLGPRLRLAPDEMPDAPTVTVCGVPVHERESVARQLAAGEFPAEPIVLGRGSTIELSTSGVTHVDGSPWPRKAPGEGRLRINAGVHNMRVWI